VVDATAANNCPKDFEGSEWLADCVERGRPVGWTMQLSQPGSDEASGHVVALMVLATEEMAFIVQSSTGGEHLPSNVARVLLRPDLKKVTFGFDEAGAKEAQSAFGFRPAGVLDLAQLAAQKGLREKTLRSLLDRLGFMVREEEISTAGVQMNPYSQACLQHQVNLAYLFQSAFYELQSLPDTNLNKDRGDPECRPGAKSLATSPASTLELKDEWVEQGIEARPDGLWCKVCDKGPMSSATVLQRHVAGQAHRKKVEAQNGADGSDTDAVVVMRGGRATKLSPEYFSQGIAVAPAPLGFPGHFYRCDLCGAGPFNAVEVIDAHIRSKRHKKLAAQAKLSGAGATNITANDPFSRGRWNLPDYVREEAGGQLRCSLCDARATALLPMYVHLGSERHARRCRGSGHDEVVYVKERGRLEIKLTGCVVVRSGFEEAPLSGGDTSQGEAPAEDESVTSTAMSDDERDMCKRESSADPGKGGVVLHASSTDLLAADSREHGLRTEKGTSDTVEQRRKDNGATVLRQSSPTARPAVQATGRAAINNANSGSVRPVVLQSSDARATLADGWKEFVDPTSGCTFYCNGKVSQWEPPGDSSPPALKSDDDEASKDGIDDAAEGVCASLSRGGVVVVSPKLQPSGLDHHATATLAKGEKLLTLPPGWYEVWQADADVPYYADMEGRRTQWQPPPAYCHMDWKRLVDTSGRAFWTSVELGMSFYEHAAGQWKRLVDMDGRVYWSNQADAIRFFEEFGVFQHQEMKLHHIPDK